MHTNKSIALKIINKREKKTEKMIKIVQKLHKNDNYRMAAC